MDTFDYLAFAERINSGEIPVVDLVIDLPIGYPLLLALFNGLGSEILIVFQFFFYFISCVLLLYESFKFKKSFGLSVFLGLLLFSVLPITIKYNLSLHVESIFTTSVVLLVTSLLYYIRTKNLKSVFFLVCSFLLCVLIRSNGFLLFPVFLIFLYDKEKVIRNLVVLFLGVLLNMSLNYHYKDKFAFGDWDRMEKITTSFFDENPDGKVVKVNKNSKKEMYEAYLISYFKEQPSFYYSLIKNNKVKRERYFFDDTSSPKCFDNKVLISTLSPTFEFYSREFVLSKYLSSREFNLNEKFTMSFFSHVIYKITFHLGLYPLLFISFVFLFFRIICQFFMNCKNERNFSFLIILQFVIAMIILLPFMNSRPQIRYLHVLNFIVCIFGVFQIWSLIIYLKKKLKS